ncbi:terminase, partial [Oenococcus oeni]
MSSTHDVEKAFKAIDFLPIINEYKDPATKYAFKILSGKQEAGYFIKLACFRHLQDLRRTEDNQEDFPYHYDLQECHRILNFASICPDVNAGKPLPLMDWQKTILCLAVGWRNEYGYKRFDRVLLSVARANGKSYLCNILLWYAFLIETKNTMNADIGYIMPVSEQQKKTWPYLQTTGHRLEEYSGFKKDFFKKYDIAIQELGIQSRKTHNKILRLSNEAGQFDSFHFLYCVRDEAGDPRYAKYDNLGKITSGQLTVHNHQLIEISTAYDSIDTKFYADEQRLKEVMEKDFDRKEDNYLCLVWAQDSLMEFREPKTWIKSNPILGLDKDGSVLDAMIKSRDSKDADGSLNEFQNRNLNMWLQVKTDSYLKLKDIENTRINEFDIKNREVFIGLDISMDSDNSALGFVFPYVDKNNQPRFHFMQHSFIPWQRAGSIDSKEKQDNVPYRKLAEQGFCSITENEFGIISVQQIFDWLVDFVTTNNLKVSLFGYDILGYYRIQDLKDTVARNFPSWPVEAITQKTSDLQ